MAIFSLASLFSKNRFANFFNRGREKEDALALQVLKNSQGLDQETIDRQTFFSNDYVDNPQSTITYLGTSFEQYLGNKVSRILKYREMSTYPIIMDSIENICDEAIVDNPVGDVMSLHIVEEVPEHIDEQIREEWDYLMHDVFQINEMAWNFFKKYITDGELYIELILDSSGKNIIGIKILPSHTMMPVYENGEIVSYIQTKRGLNSTGQNSAEQEETVTVFDKNQVVYISYGLTGDNSLDVRGYLESAIRVYNQLKNLEDSLVVYRLCLDGESRVRTSDGYKYIRDIQIGDIVYTYSTDGKTERTRITNKWNTGKKKTIRVRSRHNEIICTADHPILVKDIETGIIDYVAAGKLQIKKHQLINSSKNIIEEEVKVPLSWICDNEVAWLSENMRNKLKSKKIQIKKEYCERVAKEMNYSFNPKNIKLFFKKKYSLPVLIAERCCKDFDIDIKELNKMNKGERNNERINLPEYIDEDFARLFGFLIGDGYVNANRICFAEGTYDEINQKYISLLNKYFGNCVHKKGYVGKMCGSFTTYSHYGVKLFKKLGYIHRCKNKRIPNWVFSSSKEIKKSFIEGLIDADGHERYTPEGCWFSEIKLANKKLIEDIKEVWLSIGLSSGQIREIQPTEQFSPLLNRIIKSSKCWNIALTHCELKDFENVLSVIELEEEREVYDIEVQSDLHNFIVNNIPVHNCRSPMRRIWNVFTGSMPKGKSEEYIKGLQQKYKKKVVYNPETGATDSTANIVSLTEDFWFSKNDEGKGTTVETLDGQSTFLQDLDDLKWIRENLYKALKIPNSRWVDPSAATYSHGKAAEITREEVKFSKFVERLQRRFKFMFLDAFVTQLKLKGFDPTYTTLRLYDVQFTKSNLFKEYRELEMNNSKLSTLGSAKDLIYSEENPNGIFSLEYAMKNFFLMTDDQWIENERMLAEVKSKKPKETKTSEEGGGTETPTPEVGGAEATPPEVGAETPTPEVGGAEATPTEAGGEEEIMTIPVESKAMKGIVLTEWLKDITQPFPKL